VAVLAVNRIIVSCAAFDPGKNSQIADKTHAARHLTYLFFGPLEGPCFDCRTQSTQVLQQSRCPKNAPKGQVLQVKLSR